MLLFFELPPMAGPVIQFAVVAFVFIWLRKFVAQSSNRSRLMQRAEIQEEVFSTLSRDIHDSMGQELSLLKLKIAQVNTDGRFADIENLALKISAKARSIGHWYNADELTKQGLYFYLKEEIRRIGNNKNPVIEMECFGEIADLKPEAELMIYRIYQEALSNALKHSGASRVLITLAYDNMYVTLRVKDNGKGMPEPKKYGNGLQNIEWRNDALRGYCDLESNSEGTTIYVRIPIKKNA